MKKKIAVDIVTGSKVKYCDTQNCRFAAYLDGERICHCFPTEYSPYTTLEHDTDDCGYSIGTLRCKACIKATIKGGGARGVK